MKLYFENADVSKHVATDSQPSIRWNRDGTCQSAYFVLDEELTEVTDETLAGHFELKSDDDMVLNEFEVESFLRHTITVDSENGRTIFLITNDPVPPTPPTPEPDPEGELRQAKQMQSQQVIQATGEYTTSGVYVETEYGTEFFPLTASNMTEVLGIQGIINMGKDSYPYHSMNLDTGTGQECKIYSADDITKIAGTATAHVTFCETYSNMLVQWINACTTVEEVYAIHFGLMLADEYEMYLEMIMESAVGENYQTIVDAEYARIIPPAPEPTPDDEPVEA